MDKDLHVVGFRIGRETYGVPIGQVREILRVPEITSVPDVPDYIEGVINLRGRIVSVLDLRRRFGLKDVQPSRKNRVLVVEIGGRLVGMIVESASEVLKIPPSEVESPQNICPESDSTYVTGVGKLKGRLIILLDLDRILKRAELRRLGEISDAASTVPVTA